MSNSIEVSCSASWCLVRSLFQHELGGEAYLLLCTSQEMLIFSFSAAGYRISKLLWQNWKILLTPVLWCWGVKQDHIGPLYPHWCTQLPPDLHSLFSASLTVADHCLWTSTLTPLAWVFMGCWYQARSAPTEQQHFSEAKSAHRRAHPHCLMFVHWEPGDAAAAGGALEPETPGCPGS